MTDNHTAPIDGGYVLLSRRLLDSCVWSYNDATLRVAIYLLVCANHKTQYWCGEEVLRGQTIRSLTRISEECNMSRKAVRGSLKRLEDSEFITIDREKRAQQGHKITLCNYERYQSPESYMGTVRAQQGHTEGTLGSTNNNEENGKNEEKVEEETRTRVPFLSFGNFLEIKTGGTYKSDLQKWRSVWSQLCATTSGIDLEAVFVWAKDNFQGSPAPVKFFVSDTWPKVFSAYTKGTKQKTVFDYIREGR